MEESGTSVLRTWWNRLKNMRMKPLKDLLHNQPLLSNTFTILLSQSSPPASRKWIFLFFFSSNPLSKFPFIFIFSFPFPLVHPPCYHVFFAEHAKGTQPSGTATESFMRRKSLLPNLHIFITLPSTNQQLYNYYYIL